MHVLIRGGCPIDIVDSKNRTALDLATQAHAAGIFFCYKYKFEKESKLTFFLTFFLKKKM